MVTNTLEAVTSVPERCMAMKMAEKMRGTVRLQMKTRTLYRKPFL